MGFMDRLRSEGAYLSGALRTLRNVTPVAKNPTRTFPQVAEDLAAENGDREALISDRENLTFAEYNARANRYARWAMANDVRKGDVVALLMPNRPEYYAVWLGIARAGGATALLNTNLTGKALAHCVDIVEPKHVIVDASLADHLESTNTHRKSDAKVWITGGDHEGWQPLEPALEKEEGANIPAAELPTLTIEDRCLFIYTSGTTGLPKAANINHYRVQSIMYGFRAATRMTRDDRLYVCLPLYHSTGLLVGGGAALSAGGSVVLRERFSASHFWDDIVDRQCTCFAYVGELCRYLLNSPRHPKERKHALRLAFGNGLRPDIWEDFQARFAIPRILEWYAATEGNAVFFNFDQKVGAVGRIPKWAERRFLVEVVKFDVEREEPVRDTNGRCIKCAPDEVGEVLSQIVNDPSKPSQRFEGYSDAEATKKKILTDVFEPGDRWFRTGDLMKKDAHGYFYFVDRIGDTFRWKGENVATSEVSEAITVFPGVKEANVYGVEVAGHEGRAGMASLVVEDDFDIDKFHHHLEANLPPYARPVFLRLQDQIETTGTFKPRKVDLVKQGFDPSQISDPLYVADPDRPGFVKLDPDVHAKVTAGTIRV